MTRWILNVALLSGKELRSVMKDVTLMALILFAEDQRAIGTPFVG